VAVLEKVDQEAEIKFRKQVLILGVAFLLLFGLYFAPTMPGLKPQSQAVLGIFFWFIVCIVFDALPKAVLGLAAPMLVVVLGGFKLADAYAPFASDTFFLAIGAFIYAAIMMATPLGRRIALVVTNALRSTRATRVLAGLTLSDLVIGGVLPTVSETALFLPIAKGINSLMKGREHLPESKRINTAVLLMITGLAPLFTGPLILTSHFPNLILVGALAQAKVTVSWLDWFVYNIPLWGLLPILFLYVVWYFKLHGLEIPGADEELPRMKKELGAITTGEIWAGGCLLLGLGFWITEGSLHNISAGMVALLVVLLAFLPFGRLNFAEISKHVMWDVWILLGGAIALSGALDKAGISAWLANFVAQPLKAGGLPPLVVLLIIVFGFHIPRAGVVSAAAMGAVFIPLTMAVAQQLGMNVLPFTMVVTNCLSYAFFLPISITAFLIAWGASGASGWDVIKFGAPLSIIANLYVIFAQTAWLALLGHPLVK